MLLNWQPLMLDMPYVFVDFNLTKMKNMRKLFLRADLLLVSKEKIALLYIYIQFQCQVNKVGTNQRHQSINESWLTQTNYLLIWNIEHANQQILTTHINLLKPKAQISVKNIIIYI